MTMWPDSSCDLQCHMLFFRAALMGEIVHWVVPSRAQFEGMPLATSREVRKAGYRGGEIRFFGTQDLLNQHGPKGGWQSFVSDVFLQGTCRTRKVLFAFSLYVEQRNPSPCGVAARGRRFGTPGRLGRCVRDWLRRLRRGQQQQPRIW
jgi:hypothetical protein